MAHQWRVTWHEEGEEDVVEIMTSWSDAWAISQPLEPEGGWLYTQKDVVYNRFQNGENSINVAWKADQSERVVIERL